METSATNRKLRVLLLAIRSGALIPKPDFQRRLVWSNQHKISFLKTILDGLPFPEIFLASGELNTETGEGTEVIVDGQQRITTVFQYFNNSPDLKVVGIPTYAELSKPEKEKFLEYLVVVRDLGTLTDKETRELFYRINSTSYSLNAMEVNNARYDGALKLYCDQISGDNFFERNRVFAPLDIRRMNDVRWTLTVVITLMSTYFNRDSEHEIFLKQYNDNFPYREDIDIRLHRCFEIIDAMSFESSSRVWQKADLLSLIVELDRELRTRTINVVSLGGKLREFYRDVKLASTGQYDDSSWQEQAPPVAYYESTRSGTNDRSNRIKRGALLAGVIASAE